MVNCTSINDDLKKGYATKKITIDSILPQINLTVDKGTCGLSNLPEMKFTAYDAGTGINHYEYEYTYDGKTYTNTTPLTKLTISLDVPLKEGKNIEVKAKVYDNAGNPSTWTAIETVIVTDNESIYCDKINPEGSTIHTYYQDASNKVYLDVEVYCTAQNIIELTTC